MKSRKRLQKNDIHSSKRGSQENIGGSKRYLVRAEDKKLPPDGGKKKASGFV